MLFSVCMAKLKQYDRKTQESKGWEELAIFDECILTEINSCSNCDATVAENLSIFRIDGNITTRRKTFVTV